MEQFTAGSCIRFGWETFKKRPWFLIGADLLFVAVVGVVSGALGEIGKVGLAAGLATSIMRWVFLMIAGMGMTAFLLKAHDDVEHAALSDFWHPQPFWKYLGASVLLFLAVVGGLILLIVPGIIFGLMFGFATYLVVDRGLSPMEAMRESRRITNGHKWTLLWLGVLSILVMLLGLACLIVGVLAAMPIVSIAKIHALRELQNMARNSTETTV